MNKSEVLALGVSEEKYKAFQAAYYRDLNKLAKQKRGMEDADWKTRSAIHAMLNVIDRQETLESILKYINNLYFKEVQACRSK